MGSTTNKPKPKLACEISADRVLAGRALDGGGGLETCAARELAPGSVVPDLVENNLRQRDAVRNGIETALGDAGRSKDVIAIVPDAAVRVMLVEFDTLPSDQEEASGVVRFRLKKSLPFDVDQSAISFDRQGTANPVRVVAAVTPRTVLEEYESVVQEAGYNPGCVLPSMLAVLGLVDASHPTMVIKVERGTTTFAIVDQEQLLLYRALENGGAAVTGESLVDDVNTSLVYFEDRYGVGVDRILVTGVDSVQALQEALSATSNIRVEDLVSSTSMHAAAGANRAPLAAVMGALAS